QHQPNFSQYGSSIFADHVSGFVIRGNWSRNAPKQADIRFSSGTLEGNLMTDSPNGGGVFVAAGRVSYPAQVNVRTNRVVRNREDGLMAIATTQNVDPDLAGQN